LPKYSYKRRRVIGSEDFSKIVLISSPSLSVSGEVVFLRTTMDMDKNIYMSQVWLYDEKGLRPLTRGPSDKCPRWNSGGDTVAFTSNERPGKKEGEKGSGLWLVKPGGEPWFLKWFSNGIRWYEWSPDSKRILVITPEGKADEDVKVVDDIPVWFNAMGFIYALKNRLKIVEIDNGEVWSPPLEIGDKEEVLLARFSPDGDRIAYVLQPTRLKPFETLVRVHVVSTGEDYGLMEKPMRIRDFDWSPDGGRIVLKGSLNPRGLPSHLKLWVLDASEESQKPVEAVETERNIDNAMNSDSRGPSCSHTVHWSSDGNIYFHIAYGSEVRLYRAKPLEKPVQLIDGGVVDEFDVEGSNIAYTFMTFNHPNELYMLKNGERRKITSFNDELVEKWGLRETARKAKIPVATLHRLLSRFQQAQERGEVQALLEQSYLGQGDIERIVVLMNEYGSVEYSMAIACEYVDKAKSHSSISLYFLYVKKFS